MDAYAALDYSRTLLEVQKLAYFLQEAGEPLRLKYEAGHYGPYAANLNKVLEVMEGHFIRGYGDSQKPQAEIELLPGSLEEATDFLAGKSESLQRLNQVSQLIEGFETPYGMELLATVHGVAHRGGPTNGVPASGPDPAVEQIHAWNPRKKQVFKPEHIRTAWIHLGEQGWLRVWKTSPPPENPRHRRGGCGIAKQSFRVPGHSIPKRIPPPFRTLAISGPKFTALSQLNRDRAPAEVAMLSVLLAKPD